MEVGTSKLIHHGQEASGGQEQQASGQQAGGAGTGASSSTSKAGGEGGEAASAKWATEGDTVHVLATSNGSPYTNFQNRIMYATFQLAQKAAGGGKMVAYTRILHRTKDDVLVKEIPTFRADPLHPECDGWCEYPVADRPNAVRQFLDAARADPSLLKAPWLFMCETDYVWAKPLLPPRAEDVAALSAAFPFGYINPMYPGIKDVLTKLYSAGPLTDIPNTGPAPALMRVDEWMAVTPLWEATTAAIEGDAEAKEKLGWVREMYAFSVACAKAKIHLDLQLPPKNKLMVQPPADHGMGDAVLMHYTWGAAFKDAGGKTVWEFDKRKYTDKLLEVKTPRLEEPPPYQEGAWTLQDGVRVDRDLHKIITFMIKTMNAGVDTLHDLE